MLTKTNSSLEHVIPNALGGHLKSRNLLCREHNGRLNHLDTELARLMNPFCIRFNIQRDRGKPPSMLAKDAGDKKDIFIDPGISSRQRHPEIEETPDGIKITAGTRSRLIDEAKRLAKKDPRINVEEISRNAQRSVSRPGRQFEFEVKGDKNILLRAVSKIALNYYFMKSQSRVPLPAIQYIKDENGPNRAALISIPHQFAKAGESLHVISCIGSASEQILYAYVELFSFLSVVVVLDEEYHGADFESSYVYDVVTGTEIGELLMRFKRDELLAFVEANPDIKLSVKI